MAREDFLEALSGRAHSNNPSPVPENKTPLPDTLPTRCGTKASHPNLTTLEQGRPDEG
jgi:hypothetical protein